MFPLAASFAVVVDPPGEPAANMAADEHLANDVRQGRVPATLRIYQWDRPAITIGRRQQPDDLPQDFLKRGLPIVRRPTGGGAVLHRLDELTYALALPRVPGTVFQKVPGTFLHATLQDALIEWHLVRAEDLSLYRPENQNRCHAPEVPGTCCFSSPVCGDLLFQGRKAAGLAMRVWREVSLIQGSVQGLPVSFQELSEVLKEAVSHTFRTEWQPLALRLSA